MQRTEQSCYTAPGFVFLQVVPAPFNGQRGDGAAAFHCDGGRDAGGGRDVTAGEERS